MKNARARRTAQAAEDGTARLQQRRRSRAVEIAGERLARLLQMRARQRQTLTTESNEEREARLQQMSDNYI